MLIVQLLHEKPSNESTNCLTSLDYQHIDTEVAQIAKLTRTLQHIFLTS